MVKYSEQWETPLTLAPNRQLSLDAVGMILWPWDDFVRPIRSYFARKNRSRWKQRRDKGICSSCKLPFDNEMKRCIVDSCGHNRCYACLYTQNMCPLCSTESVSYKPQPKLKSIQTDEKLERQTLNKSSNRKRQKLGDIQYYDADYKRMKRFSQISNISSEFPFDATFSNIALNSITLKPLYFEVPLSTEECFLHRDWILEQICEVIMTQDSRGVVLEGIEGSGKTSLILQLVEWSSFGSKRKSAILYDVPATSWDTLMKLSSLVVGYHFCQVDCRETCLVPDFIHSLAAQLCQAPQLEKYRNIIALEERYQELLSLESCIENPDKAFLKGILEPLAFLNSCTVFPSILVIDSIHESEGFTRSISSFLATYINRFPSWLKVILTVNSENLKDLSTLPFRQVNLNCEHDRVREDLLRYIRSRVKNSPAIEMNVSTHGSENQLSRFADYLIGREKSSFLFVKLVLDLIEQNHLVVKSTTFNVIPVSLDEIFLLIFNLRFPSLATFAKVKPILEVCLAAWSPLTAVDIFYSMESASVLPSVSWSDFTEILNSLSGLLIQRRDQSLILSNTALRRWLMKNNKFLCDVRFGHTCLALLPTRLRYTLTPDKELELISHVTCCNLFKDEDLLKCLWINFSMIKLSEVLINPRVIFSPNEQVIHFILKAGADPNSTLFTYHKYPVLNLICKMGSEKLATTFLNFGADPNMTDIFGTTALMEAALYGHVNVIKNLLAAGAKIHLKDKAGRCALYWAAENGHLNVVQLLIKTCNWPSPSSFSEAKQRALIVAAGINNLEMCKYLLKANVSEKANNSTDYQDNVTCQFVLENSIKPGNLHQAAASGHLQSIYVLCDKGIALDTKDAYGRTALAWACIYGKVEMVRFLIEKGADVTIKDNDSFNFLHMAAICGDDNLVKLFLEKGVDAEAKNTDNKTPLECAIATKHSSAAIALLEEGVNIGSGAFEATHGVPKFYSILLNKLLCDGVSLYKKGDFVEASRRFEYALDKATKESNFEQMRSSLLEGILLCKRKMENKDMKLLHIN